MHPCLAFSTPPYWIATGYACAHGVMCLSAKTAPTATSAKGGRDEQDLATRRQLQDGSRGRPNHRQETGRAVQVARDRHLADRRQDKREAGPATPLSEPTARLRYLLATQRRYEWALGSEELSDRAARGRWAIFVAVEIPRRRWSPSSAARAGLRGRRRVGEASVGEAWARIEIV
jgi:hypothetical protein